MKGLFAGLIPSYSQTVITCWIY